MTGKSINRVDGYAKVTGTAAYTDDICPANCLVGKVVRSSIANGRVTAIHTEAALKIPGVEKVVTCFEIPDIRFPTSGHPWSTDPAHQDIADRRLLNERVRIYGDDIAVVVARDELSACQGVAAIKVEYEEYTPLLTPQQAMAHGASQLHGEYPSNVLAHSHYILGEGSFDEVVEKTPDLVVVKGDYTTQTVQHCHLENVVCYSYMESGRIVVVTSTQIPHIVRRVVGQALGIRWGMVRVVKPYIGGGFGNKQDVLYEPLCAYLTTVMGGRAVKLELTREETFGFTRVRHAIDFHLATAATKEGIIVARKFLAYSNQGGYASHGHAIVSNAGTEYRQIYNEQKTLESDCYTVYTNISTGGAMRGYGIPQVCFAMESQMDDLAKTLCLDPIELRLKNCIQEGYVDPLTGVTCHSSALVQCIERGKRYIDWEEKLKEYENQTGSLRHGVGMSIFSYKTGVYPISLETAGARLALVQDGSVILTMGATEIGQGADTIFTQMAAETIGLRLEDIHIVTTQDTDSSPFDTGAYASRQSYVSGMAIKKAGELFKEKLLERAAQMLELDSAGLDIIKGHIVEEGSNESLMTVATIAMESYYNMEHSQPITVDITNQLKDNTISFGACFVDIEVDIPLGKIKILDIINVHDSGRIINPALAQAQVHGGMSMGLGYALGERLIYDKNARPLNNNLLDYKLPTSMDTPELQVEFAKSYDPSGPYGNKSLGEPPTIPVAPSIRNALLNATGVAVNDLPLYPQRLVEEFTKAGLINRGVLANV